MRKRITWPIFWAVDQSSMANCSAALDDADFLAIFPMKGEGRARLVGTVRQEADRQHELRWDDVSQTIIHHLKLNVAEVKWFSSYRVHHRVAAHFQNANVFLLGGRCSHP